MADRGGPTEQDRSEGMPSLSEAPNERGKSPWLLGAVPSDPPSGRNHKWPLPQEWICMQSTKDRSAMRPPSRAGSLPHLNRVHPRKSGRLVGRLALAVDLAFDFLAPSRGRAQVLRSG
ncbi:hypothetical protein CES87_24160 [Pseudomonas sp. ERMR1:02]|nr:hypothetical protein CES87_24160 [Pseudomonas sp. ERMR1:02]